jgi:hypothetical protein
MQTGRFTYRTPKHKHSLILICTLYSSCALAGPAAMWTVHCSIISVQEPWQSRGSPVMITERTRSNRNEMEQLAKWNQTESFRTYWNFTTFTEKLPQITENFKYVVSASNASFIFHLCRIPLQIMSEKASKSTGNGGATSVPFPVPCTPSPSLNLQINQVHHPHLA